MRNASQTVALLLSTIVLVWTPGLSRAQGLSSLLTFGSCCGRGCESGCGCEPSCGCAGGCGVDGRQFAGQAWHGSGCDGCAGPCGCDNSCGPGCGCEPTCAAEPSCGCSSGRQCGGGGCCESLFKSLFGCNGCHDEVYWCEWRNDPPRCCEPCDTYGNWIGPSAGAYRAPYSHPYAVGGSLPSSQYVNTRSGPRAPTYAASRTKPPAGLPTARRSIATQTPRAATPSHTQTWPQATGL
ncbi:MAG: hypothetical protein WD669_07460, partial [Pirellulales bacterium]